MTASPSTSTTSPVIFYADQEHAGLRTAVFLLLILGILIFYLLLDTLWPQIAPLWLVDFTFIFACSGSIILALASIWGIEQGLKRVWHSGRTLTLNENGIQVQDNDLLPYSLSWNANMNQLYWHFALKSYKRGGRERRVPEKWICLAVQIQEDEARVIAHTYLSQKQAEKMKGRHGRVHFHEIHPADVYSSDTGSGRFLSAPSRPDKIPAEVLAGKDGKHWLAEQRRWVEGFELSPTDFEKFIELINSH